MLENAKILAAQAAQRCAIGGEHATAHFHQTDPGANVCRRPSRRSGRPLQAGGCAGLGFSPSYQGFGPFPFVSRPNDAQLDRKSTRLNSSHGYISYAVFCLKKKKKL